jgi:hypothetical protein
VEYLQPDLFSGVTDPMAVAAAVPRPAGVSWEQLKPRPGIQCAHCVLVVEAQIRDPERAGAPDPIRLAGWRRYGALGCVTLLCAGHRRLQRNADRTPKIN